MKTDKLLNHIKENYPKEAECKECGLPFMSKWPTNKFCPECAKKRAREQAIASRKKHYSKIKQKQQNKRETEKIMKQNRKNNIQEHVCIMSATCKYGISSSDMACNYADLEKQLRSKNGKHKIINGVCDLYEFDPNKKPRRKHLTL